MRAAVIQGANQPLEIREVPDPIPDAEEIVLAVEASGICGSDLHFAQHFPVPGLVMGHEFTGRVVEVGSRAPGDWRIDDAVVCLPIRGCGRCPACRDANPRKCRTAQGIGIERPGGYAEYVAVGAREAIRRPEALSAHQGALVEPLAVGLHTLDLAGLEAGDDVLILGAGPVGATVALWARSLGAREVVVSDPVEHRRELAVELGASVAIDPSVQDLASEYERATGQAPKTVIECVGIPGMIEQALDVAAVDATIVVAGVCMERDNLTPLTGITKELTLRFVYYYHSRDFDRTIAALEAGQIDISPIVTDVVSLAEMPQRFSDLARPTSECKVVVEPQRAT